MYTVSDDVRARFSALSDDPRVRAVLASIRDDERRCLDEQKELVLIEAPTFHEEARARVLAEKFASLGLEDVHTDRGGNVVGLRRGSGDTRLRVLVEGHLDTVFPFGTVTGVDERDGYLYAPGIGDDTRALAMMLCVIRALNAARVETHADVVFVGTTREEGLGGLGGMRDFLDDNPDIDISLSIDNNDMSSIVYGATRSESDEFTFSGQGGHAYGAFGKVAQPNHAAARAVAKIADLDVPASPKTTFCVSNIHGGTDAGLCAIAAHCSFKVNYRSNGAAEFESLRRRISDAAAAAARDESARWGKNEIAVTRTVLDEVPGGTQDVHSPLVEAEWLALRSLGVEPSFAEGGSTNANIPISRGIPAICMGRAFTHDERSRTVHNHSVDEHFSTFNSYKAVQNVALMLLFAAGLKTDSGF